jgi:hypothetical protein
MALAHVSHVWQEHINPVSDKVSVIFVLPVVMRKMLVKSSVPIVSLDATPTPRAFPVVTTVKKVKHSLRLDSNNVMIVNLVHSKRM